MARETDTLGVDENPRQGAGHWHVPQTKEAPAQKETNPTMKPDSDSKMKPGSDLTMKPESDSKAISNYPNRRPSTLAGSVSPFASMPWSPRVEMFHRGDKLIVRAELPGMSKQNVKVDLEDDLLRISGERNDEREEHREGIYLSESSYGTFLREIPLPAGVNGEQCDATFKDGILEVILSAPQAPVSNKKQIPIK